MVERKTYGNGVPPLPHLLTIKLFLYLLHFRCLPARGCISKTDRERERDRGGWGTICGRNSASTSPPPYYFWFMMMDGLVWKYTKCLFALGKREANEEVEKKAQQNNNNVIMCDFCCKV